MSNRIYIAPIRLLASPLRNGSLKAALLAIGALTLASGCLNATTLDVSAVSAGLLTNQVASQGVEFEGPEGQGFSVCGCDNYVYVGLGTSSLDFVAGSYPGVTDSVSLTEAPIDTDYDSFFNGSTISAYDVNGNLLETQTLEPEGPYFGTLPALTLTFSVAGIHELVFQSIRDYAGNGALPIEISFDTITGTPEPATPWLMAAGLGAAALLRRRIA